VVTSGPGQCVPEAFANLISVTIRDGCSFVTRDNGAYVAMVGGNGWEGSVREQNGLYTLRYAPASVSASCPMFVCYKYRGREERSYLCRT
jgi:hypothetical protein